VSADSFQYNIVSNADTETFKGSVRGNGIIGMEKLRNSNFYDKLKNSKGFKLPKHISLANPGKNSSLVKRHTSRTKLQTKIPEEVINEHQEEEENHLGLMNLNFSQHHNSITHHATQSRENSHYNIPLPPERKNESVPK
jgi:hypothetical protein